jgi:hypothetical protein
MSAATCTIRGCGRKVRAKQLCAAHYTRAQRHGDPGALNEVRARHEPRYRDELPAGYWSDVSVLAPGLFGAVIVCEACGFQLGPVFTPASAAMAIHGHQLRAHNAPGRRHDST